MVLPSPDLLTVNPKNIDDDFHILLQYNDLPIDFSPCRINHCLVCVCLAGYAEIEVDLRSFRFELNDIIVVFPGQILACNEKSTDFSLSHFSFSNQLIDDILYRFPTEFIEFLRESVKYHLPEVEKDSMLTEYFAILLSKFRDMRNVCRREIITNLVHNFYLDLYNKVIACNEILSRQRKHKKELQEEFFQLVKTHTNNREVAFFAGKLCITPKYLSIITKQSTGSSAKELIDKFAITELKLRLRSSSTQLKEIAAQLNYPCEAFLCKYFKRHAGMTPSHYRNSSR
jgi:AraC family transcriptional regulator, transcriptional activator of pobA